VEHLLDDRLESLVANARREIEHGPRRAGESDAIGSFDDLERVDPV